MAIPFETDLKSGAIGHVFIKKQGHPMSVLGWPVIGLGNKSPQSGLRFDQ